jgi:transposase-like protein
MVGEKNPATKLTPDAVRQIRESDESRSVLAQRYGVHPQSIYHVRAGVTHREVS